eukprot:jgi/Astpho2/4280/e_gw1.00064.65.1_t
MAEEQPGFYCSTSGTFFADKDSLTEHYRSDFHKYNLKRKLAGLPPVTKDWFEARRNQLSGTASGGPVHKVWFDPLTKKRFNTENTYQAHVNSKKYKELLKKLGKETPAPVVSIKRPDGPDKDQDMDEASSGWETASDDGDRAAPGPGGRQAEQAQRPAAEPDEEWEEWDVGRSLFDNHQSDSMEANLEYMFKNFGFYFPDAEYLTDPEGLLKYLVSWYRALGIATMQSKQPDKEQTRAQKLQKKFARLRLKNELKANVIRDLPRNVTF